MSRRSFLVGFIVFKQQHWFSWYANRHFYMYFFYSGVGFSWSSYTIMYFFLLLFSLFFLTWSPPRRITPLPKRPQMTRYRNPLVPTPIFHGRINILVLVDPNLLALVDPNLLPQIETLVAPPAANERAKQQNLGNPSRWLLLYLPPSPHVILLKMISFSFSFFLQNFIFYSMNIAFRDQGPGLLLISENRSIVHLENFRLIMDVVQNIPSESGLKKFSKFLQRATMNYNRRLELSVLTPDLVLCQQREIWD